MKKLKKKNVLAQGVTASHLICTPNLFEHLNEIILVSTAVLMLLFTRFWLRADALE